MRYTLFQGEIHARRAIIREIHDNKKGDWSPFDFGVLNFGMAEVRPPGCMYAHGRDGRQKRKKKNIPGIASIRRASVAPVPANEFPNLMRDARVNIRSTCYGDVIARGFA